MKHDTLTIAASGLSGSGESLRGPSLELDRFAQGALLADAWTRLERGATLPTQGLGFVTALSRSLLAGTRLEVFIGRGAGGIRGLIPLCRGEGRWARWRLAGTCEIFEPGDALCEDEAGAGALAEALARDAGPVTLDRLPASSALIPALRRAMRGRGLVSVRPAMASPFIRLDPSWQRAEDHFNAGRRSDFRRAARRAAAIAPVFHEVIVPELSEFDRLFDEAVAIEQRGWKDRSGSAMARDPAKEAFFRDWLRDACAQGSLRIAFLRIGQQAVAMQMALVMANRFWLLKIGYDEAYGKCSPGNLLMLHTIGHAAREGLETYEMLGAMEPWIADLWTQERHECLRLRTYPFSLAGLLALAQDGREWLRGRLARAPE
ncbi:MAG: GNAT family N-acetyltransferase [Sphingomonadales bacterium]|nr:GNAT family N-acetyltransferase [Sphingomonadales bacterium]MDE2168242.1 GNAT family N-acetyltransferase [Sphingomonadales bacterium]